MAKGILSCLKKRDLLHQEQVDRGELSRYGREYLNQERLVDALDFFEKAEDREGILEIKRLGLEQGDPFLVKQACKLLKETPDPDLWKKVGEKAESLGKYAQALTAFEAAREDQKVEEIRRLMGSYHG